MRRLITLFFLVFILSGVAFAQQMSDEQVVQYVKNAQQMGKNQKQITTELMRRGVTKEQVERIQEKYKESKTGDLQNKTQEGNRSRRHIEQNGATKAKGIRVPLESAKRTDIMEDSLQMTDERTLYRSVSEEEKDLWS